MKDYGRSDEADRFEAAVMAADRVRAERANVIRKSEAVISAACRFADNQSHVINLVADQLNKAVAEYRAANRRLKDAEEQSRAAMEIKA